MTDEVYEFQSIEDWTHPDRGKIFFCETVEGDPTHLYPRQLLGKTVRVNGEEFVCQGVEAHCVQDGHPALRKFGLSKGRS